MRNILSQSSSEVPVVTIEHKDSSKRDIYPEIRSDYTYRVGSLFEELIRESIEDMGFDTELKDVNTEGVDIDTEDKKIGIEAWNWSSEHSYLKREESVLHNLRPYIVRILFASFINKEAKQRIESHYKEDPVIVKEIGYQVLPKKYYGFYKKYDRLEGKRFVSKRLKKELKNIIKSTVINAVRERGHKFNMEVDGPHIITTYNKEELKERKKKTVDCYIPEDGYVYSYCDLTSNDLNNTSSISEVTSGLKNKGKNRLKTLTNDKYLLSKAGIPVPEINESQEAIPGIVHTTNQACSTYTPCMHYSEEENNDEYDKSLQMTFPWHGKPGATRCNRKIESLVPSCRNCFQGLNDWCNKTGLNRIKCLKQRAYLSNKGYNYFKINTNHGLYDLALDIFWKDIKKTEKEIRKKEEEYQALPSVKIKHVEHQYHPSTLCDFMEGDVND